MKKLICTAVLSIFSQAIISQNFISDFEGFNLAANSAYTSTNSTPFQTPNAIFEHEWLNAFGGLWIGGFAYTNSYDTISPGFNNLYGVKPYKGNNASATYVIGQDGGTIKLKQPSARVNGFYITNTTYAFSAIKIGNSFSRKFGDTTGTGSGTSIPQGSYPDYFKVTARGFLNGNLKSDSAVFYLADYRFSNNAQDYIVKTWQYFNLSGLGIVDSIRFNMFSSDTRGGYINTPLFFGMDDFSTSPSNPVDIIKSRVENNSVVYPNPFNQQIKILMHRDDFLNGQYQLINELGEKVLEGAVMQNAFEINTSVLKEGIYFLQLINENGIETKRIVKLEGH